MTPTLTPVRVSLHRQMLDFSVCHCHCHCEHHRFGHVSKFRPMECKRLKGECLTWFNGSGEFERVKTLRSTGHKGHAWKCSAIRPFRFRRRTSLPYRSSCVNHGTSCRDQLPWLPSSAGSLDGSAISKPETIGIKAKVALLEQDRHTEVADVCTTNQITLTFVVRMCFSG